MDKTTPNSEFCSQGQCKPRNDLETGGTEHAKSGLNENPAVVEASGMRDLIGRATDTLNMWEDTIEDNSPTFVGDVLNDLGLDGKPVLVVGGILVALYVIYKVS
jgi:hypothetical protein